MKTTARIEGSSMPGGGVQLSIATAKLVEKARKGHWLEKRVDKIKAKGKGEMETFWLKPNFHHIAAAQRANWSSMSGSTYTAHDPELEFESPERLAQKSARLIDWNVETLLRLIQQVVAQRNALAAVGERPVEPLAKDPPMAKTKGQTTMFLEEVTEIIALPEFDRKQVTQKQQDPENVILPPEVEVQLFEYVTCIAGMYRNNPFHNFERSHVGHQAHDVHHGAI